MAMVAIKMAMMEKMAIKNCNNGDTGSNGNRIAIRGDGNIAILAMVAIMVKMTKWQ